MAQLRGTVVCIAVPQGSHRPQPLAEAVSRAHPDWTVGALWCGDPQLHPSRDGGCAWWDTPMATTDWERVLVSARPHTAEWRQVLAVVPRLMTDGAESVVVLFAGDVAVAGSLASLVEPRDGAVMTLVPRVLAPLPDDGLAPDEADLLEAGRFSTTAVVFHRGAEAALAWLDARLGDAPLSEVGRWLELAAAHFAVDVCTDPTIGVGLWRWDDVEPSLIDAPTYDPDRPEVLDPQMTGAGRIQIVGVPERQRVLDAVGAEFHGRRRPVALPGGVPVDDVVRGVIERSSRQSWDEAPPLPWSQWREFRAWLEQRYWTHLHSRRRDLAAEFPRPAGADDAAFRRWSCSAFAVDDVPFLLSNRARRRDVPTVSADPRTDGINLVGYLTRDSSLGDVARRIGEGLAQAGVAVATIASQRTASPPLAAPRRIDQHVEYATSLAVVTADQFPLLAGDLPGLFTPATRMIGYWFWELEHVPDGMRAAIELVDEIWAGSRFVADAFAAVSRVPVRHVPIPVPEPGASPRSRADFPPLAGRDDRFAFLMSFDHLSVTERKNPVGAIEAFRRAFAPDEGPVLVVKTMNARIRWRHHQRVLAAAGDRPDIVVWDEHLSRADHMALVREVDGVVSLHRSEGLGLHLAEAMWLRTPTIATACSGNVDFMDDTCALLVPYERVHVTGGEGVYPASAMWAAPDLDAAADSMRALVDDAALRGRISDAGRARMESQPSLAQTGSRIAALAGVLDRRQ